MFKRIIDFLLGLFSGTKNAPDAAPSVPEHPYMPFMPSTSESGIRLIKHYEGLRLEAYPDPATGGKPWTIGYGHTGPDVYAGLVITEPEAERLLRERIAKEFEPGVRGALTVKPSQNEFDAMVSLAYNIGVHAFSISTLVRRFNAGDTAGAADEFLRWKYAGGRVLLGLQRRRTAERAMFLGADANTAIKIGNAIK